MNKSLRKAIIAGNWKMNKTRPEAKELLEAIKPLVDVYKRQAAMGMKKSKFTP